MLEECLNNSPFKNYEFSINLFQGSFRVLSRKQMIVDFMVSFKLSFECTLQKKLDTSSRESSWLFLELIFFIRR